MDPIAELPIHERQIVTDFCMALNQVDRELSELSYADVKHRYQTVLEHELSKREISTAAGRLMRQQIARRMFSLSNTEELPIDDRERAYEEMVSYGSLPIDAYVSVTLTRARYFVHSGQCAVTLEILSDLKATVGRHYHELVPQSLRDIEIQCDELRLLAGGS